MSRHILFCATCLAAMSAFSPVRAGNSSNADAAPEAPQPRRWSMTLQTGIAETFQLTSGGVYGLGPAWQNRVTLGAGNLFLTGDTMAVSGWTTHDSHSHRNDWLASFSYKLRAYRQGNHSLYLGGGLERWRFPSVLTGARD